MIRAAPPAGRNGLISGVVLCRHGAIKTRMESSAVALREAKEGEREKQGLGSEKSTGNAEGDDGVEDDGGGPGGGDRRAAKGPKILHKSSKEFYKAMAKQWGITCKMSDHCRCLDCQVRVRNAGETISERFNVFTRLYISLSQKRQS